MSDDKFSLDEWLMSLELEEERNNPHYSVYFTPEYEEEIA